MCPDQPVFAWERCSLVELLKQSYIVGDTYDIELRLDGLRCLKHSVSSTAGCRRGDICRKYTYPHDTFLEALPTHRSCQFIYILERRR
jgi:hypothetical protein